MATNESTHGGGFLVATKTIVGIIGGLLTTVAVAGILYTFLPSILKTYNTPLTDMLATADTGGLKATPTQRAITDERRDTTIQQPAAAPNVQQDIDNFNATQTAQFPQPNVDALPANAPMPQYVERQAVRQPAGDNVPTAEPVVEGAPVVNVQETHECRHGQIWTDSGCKNLPSDKGSKVRP